MKTLEKSRLLLSTSDLTTMLNPSKLTAALGLHEWSMMEGPR
jgi:hypothetical protein